MAREEMVPAGARVEEVLPGRRFRVRLEGGELALVTPAGRLRGAAGRFFVGDDVDVELSPYDLTRGRIVGKSGEEAT